MIKKHKRLVIAISLIVVVFGISYFYWQQYIKPSGGYCIAVVSSIEAQNPITKQKKVFGSVCEIPSGWKIDPNYNNLDRTFPR